jgi:hypothetical protein
VLCVKIEPAVLQPAGDAFQGQVRRPAKVQHDAAIGTRSDIRRELRDVREAEPCDRDLVARCRREVVDFHVAVAGMVDEGGVIVRIRCGEQRIGPSPIRVEPVRGSGCRDVVVAAAAEEKVAGAGGADPVVAAAAGEGIDRSVGEQRRVAAAACDGIVAARDLCVPKNQILQYW